MKKIKVLIIDDEKLAREIIKEYLASYPEIEIAGESKDAYEAYRQINDKKPDLIFLDIQMPEVNGFELIKMLDDVPEIIFSTAYDQYAIKAFEVNAVDYLLKPYDQERFDAAIRKVIGNIESGNANNCLIRKLINSIPSKTEYLTRVLIKQPGKIIFVSANDLIYIQAMDDYVEIHDSETGYLVQQSMSYMEKNLDPEKFIRIHRSYIVNLDFIRKITTSHQGRYELFLKNGKSLPVSRSGIAKLKRFVI